jgi:hypothetical protein
MRKILTAIFFSLLVIVFTPQLPWADDDDVQNVPAGASKAEIQQILDAAPVGQTVVFSGTYDFSQDPGIIRITKHLNLRSDDDEPAHFFGTLGADGRAALGFGNSLFRFIDPGDRELTWNCWHSS